MGKVDRTIFFMIDCNYNFPVEVQVCEIKTYTDFTHWLRVFDCAKERNEIDRIVIFTGKQMLKKFSLSENGKLFIKMDELWRDWDYEIAVLACSKDIVKYLS